MWGGALSFPLQSLAEPCLLSRMEDRATFPPKVWPEAKVGNGGKRQSPGDPVPPSEDGTQRTLTHMPTTAFSVLAEVGGPENNSFRKLSP